MKNILLIPFLLLVISCQNGKDNAKQIKGKIEREQLSIVSKIPGRIEKILVEEGDIVEKGDTLMILSMPEVEAKNEQALGALSAAQAQYDMAVKGATDAQLIQLKAKVDGLNEQYQFAQKSLNRLEKLLQDSLVSQQQFDEVFAKYQGAKNQYLAANAEWSDAQHGARVEQRNMALGQKERALGAVSEVAVAAKERFIIAPQKMSIESINLKVGELALAGYSIVNGYLEESTYFRFTVAEDQLSKVKNGDNVLVNIIYQNNQQVEAKIVSVKPLTSYAQIATAYPDFDQQQTLFEIKVVPSDLKSVEKLATKASVTLTTK